MKIKIIQQIIDRLRNKNCEEMNLCKNNFVAWYSKSKYIYICS